MTETYYLQLSSSGRLLLDDHLHHDAELLATTEATAWIDARTQLKADIERAEADARARCPGFWWGWPA
ncbi:hypothetical protein [Chitinimonas lacunae]|uniref:Uncharacterized protein n=1 Tax=Chitinimonas lacunae TaxID=1963018 RepID=A0ABV8MJE6_9NEIS